MGTKIALGLLVATFATMFAGCHGRLTVRPENIAVLYGMEVAMKCSTNSSQKLMWRTQWNRSEGVKTIYTGTKLVKDLPSYYRISSNKEGDVDLVTKANEITARAYTCEEFEESASAELIALVSDPVCIDWNEKNKMVGTEKLPLKLVCRILYWGDWVPVMEWKQISAGDNGDETSTSITEGVSHKSDNNSVESTLMVTGGQRLNGIRYACITRFTGSNRPKSVTANNTPEYSYTWEYPSERNTVEKVAGNLVVIFIVVLVVIVSALVGYIVFMKRKKTTDEPENLAMDAIASAPRRTFCEESDYVEIGRASVIDDSRCSGGFYVGLDDQEMAKANFYAALEDKQQGCGASAKNK